MKLINFEGCIAAGKTSLTNYFSKLKKATKFYDRDEFVLCDFSIESNLIHAKLCLNKGELEVFEGVYN